MPDLARRRYKERVDCWHVYFGDVQVGTIARSVGNPNASPQWQWICGFYPGSDPGEYRNGTAATFEQARDDFEGAWRVFSAKRTEADFQAWRDQRDWTTRKYAMWEAGEKRSTPSKGHRPPQESGKRTATTLAHFEPERTRGCSDRVSAVSG